MDGDNYDDGYYCRHLNCAWECKEKCRCGHLHLEHVDDDNEPSKCQVEGCGCERFEDEKTG